MSQPLYEPSPTVTHYSTSPSARGEKETQIYQRPDATHGYFTNDQSAHCVDANFNMSLYAHNPYQTQTAGAWNALPPTQDGYHCQPLHHQHFLPHYYQLWQRPEVGTATHAPALGYATLNQQSEQGPTTVAETRNDDCRSVEQGYVPLVRAHTDGANPKSPSSHQAAIASRSRRTSRASYPHNSPGPPKASPVQRFTDASGREFMRFEYTMNRKKTQVELRCDVDHVDITSLSNSFKRDNACYKEAGDGNIDQATVRARMYERGKTESEMRTRLKRMKYEVDCNRIGWKLAALNGDKLAGKKGMIQRAADSYRNSGPDSRAHSRRMTREVIKARRRAADGEASRSPVAASHNDQHLSVSPTRLAAQSPPAVAFPPHQPYHSGYGFGPVDNGPAPYLANNCIFTPETDSRSSSSASATMPPTPYSSSQVLATPSVRVQPQCEPAQYDTFYHGLDDSRTGWQRYEDADVNIAASSVIDSSRTYARQQMDMPHYTDLPYRYTDQW